MESQWLQTFNYSRLKPPHPVTHPSLSPTLPFVSSLPPHPLPTVQRTHVHTHARTSQGSSFIAAHSRKVIILAARQEVSPPPPPKPPPPHPQLPPSGLPDMSSSSRSPAPPWCVHVCEARLAGGNGDGCRWRGAGLKCHTQMKTAVAGTQEEQLDSSAVI